MAGAARSVESGSPCPPRRDEQGTAPQIVDASITNRYRTSLESTRS